MSRRSRRSSGLGAEEYDPLSEFDSFRRRHARQNRDIITDNITRKSNARAMQDQISSLQAELLEAQRQNAALSRENLALKSRKFHQAAAALDTILQAVPELQRLRDTLATGAPRAKRNGAVVRVAPVARVAASTAPGLECLVEESESPARSSTSSSATSPFTSPSPKRTPRRRRRRESGFFPPPLSPTPEKDREAEDEVEEMVTPTVRRVANPRVLEVAAKEAKENATTAQPQPAPKSTPRRRRSKPSPRKPKSPQTCPPSSPLTPAPEPASVHAPAALPTSPSPAPVAQTSSSRPSLSASASTSSGSTANIASTSIATWAVSSASADSSLLAPPALASAAPAEDSLGARSRRARSSVSYKEPSLNSKMRKPDGVAYTDALGMRPRASVDGGVRRKSALPRSMGKPDLGSLDDDANIGDVNLPTLPPSPPLALPALTTEGKGKARAEAGLKGKGTARSEMKRNKEAKEDKSVTVKREPKSRSVSPAATPLGPARTTAATAPTSPSGPAMDDTRLSSNAAKRTVKRRSTAVA